MRFKRQGGRKRVVLPEEVDWAPALPRVDNAMVKALARGHRWKRMLESGEFASIKELAAEEKVNESYLCRVLRLTLLAPDIVEAIIDGRQRDNLHLNDLLQPISDQWQAQRLILKF